MTATSLKQPLADLEKLLATSGPAIKAEAPDQHARLTRLVQGMKKSDGKLTPQAQQDLLEIYKWQLTAQRKEYVDQLASLAPVIKTGDPLGLQAEGALRKLIELFDGAIAGAGTPNAQLQKNLEKVGAQAREALLALDAGVTKRLKAAMKPVPGGVIRSKSGVALQPAKPTRPASPEAAKPLQAFRVMPGTSASKAPTKKK